MLRVALTGGIATGKSYARAAFEGLGVPTIDADVIAREAVAPGSAGLAAVVARFGDSVLDAAGALDRRRLGAVVFADASARRDLEDIVHPVVRARIDGWIAALDATRHSCAIADIPLLYETGRDKDFDRVIVTACDPETQVRRIVARDGISEAEARQRVSAQWPIEEKARRADYVIRTDGDMVETDRQVENVHERLVSSL